MNKANPATGVAQLTSEDRKLVMDFIASPDCYFFDHVEGQVL